MHSYSQHRFSYLLLALLLTILIDPLVEESPFLSIVFDICTSLIFIFGCFAVSSRKIIPWVAVALSIPMLLSIWAGYLGADFSILLVSGKISGMLYCVLVAWVFLGFVFSAKDVNWQVIAVAMIVYLILGLMWGFAYSLIEILQPASFRLPGDLIDSGSGFMYYSFITLTTVGYGDITPVTGVARSFTLLEGIIGQFYMTVLVARLVSMHVASARG